MFKVYKKILKYVPEKKYLAYISILLTTVSTVVTVGSYYYLSEFLKGVIVNNNIYKSKEYALTVTGMLAISAILYFISVFICHIIGFRLETNLRKRGIDELTKASFRFFDLNSSGKIRKIIDDNASQTHQIVAHLIPDNAGAILTPIFILILGFFIGIKVGVVLVLLTIVSGFLLKLMMGEQEFMKYYQKALENLSSETVEYVRGIQVIKIFGTDVSSFKALYKAIKDYSKYAYDYSQSCKKPYVRYQWGFFGVITIIIPIVVLTMDISKNPQILAVELIMILFLSGIIFNSFMKVMYVSMYAFQGVSAVDKLEELFNEMQKDKLKFGNKDTFNNFDIEFENVSFGYTKDMIIDNLSFKLKQNKSYALVGSSGSGKSTIAKLISGFYKVNKGVIKIGGEAIEKYREECLIKNIAFVFQNVKLFKTTIYENVKLANEKATREEVINALYLAGCGSILDKFKDRENTVIGSKGVYLSGGEKQRIAIARAILKDAKIVILDEASAAVDPENEHELQIAFSNLMKDKTVIMIAHRLTSIRNVDEILVIEDGKIIERGNDLELMSIDSKYKEFQETYGKANNWRIGYEEFC